jgi:hypothetical protein
MAHSSSDNLDRIDALHFWSGLDCPVRAV